MDAIQMKTSILINNKNVMNINNQSELSRKQTNMSISVKNNE